jgi:cell wall-associated NlpC family hydrolase
VAHSYWLTIAAALALLPLPGDGELSAAAEPAAWRQSVTADLRPGDIVFRRGVGPTADAVSLASLSSAGMVAWTHVGIVAQLAKDGPLYVVHAIDDRGVVMDPPERFFSAAESSAGTFVRLGGGEGVARIAMGFVGRAFDASLSLFDHEDFYCTELIFVSMRQAGIRLDIPLRKLPMHEEPVMFPDDLYRVLVAHFRAMLPPTTKTAAE